MKINPDDILTPQGWLKDVEKNPNLDFLMNIFRIRRAFGVSGFGESWSVGKHSFATGLIALYWAKFNKFTDVKRDKLCTLAMLHDLHEAVTGDILPMFKTPEIRDRLDELQTNIHQGLGVKTDKNLVVDLKIVDMIAFLYEMRQVSPSILNPKKLGLANIIAEKHIQNLYRYCKEHRITKIKVQKFLKTLEIN